MSSTLRGSIHRRIEATTAVSCEARRGFTNRQVLQNLHGGRLQADAAGRYARRIARGVADVERLLAPVLDAIVRDLSTADLYQSASTQRKCAHARAANLKRLTLGLPPLFSPAHRLRIQGTIAR
jgi:hypothetical protein